MRMKLSKKVIGIVPILILMFIAAPVSAAVTSVTPNTWNIVGLDSNTPGLGPNHFPVGAKVCSDAAGTVPVTLTWDSANPYVYLRNLSKGTPGNDLELTFSAAGCLDAYFEVEVDKNAGNAPFDTTRLYHITAGGVSTPTPRELFVEHLVSQSRNGIDDIKLNGVSIPAGASMNLMVGNTYEIKLYGHTAPGGYNQFEEFINFSNTIFQIQSINTTYSTNDSPYVNGAGHPQLYADACKWENDPNSPYYRSCWEDWKSGDIIVTTYTVKIISGGGTRETLGSLLYDFSGSSFHYNADYSTGLRFANIIDPTNLTISKGFFPNPTNTVTGSTLSFTISNPNAGAISGLNFIDVFPTSPGAMTVASPLTTNNTCGGTLTDSGGGALGAGDVGIKLTGGTVAANSSCVVTVKVTVPTTGTYTNTSQNLFVDTLNTTKSATAVLTVNTTAPPSPPPSSCASPVELARWKFDPTTTIGGATISAGTAITNQQIAASSRATDVSSTNTYAQYGAAATSTSGIANGTTPIDWGGSCSGSGAVNCPDAYDANTWGIRAGWPVNAIVPTSSTTPYFEFVIDTSNYGGVGITASYDLEGNWSNGDNWYVLSSDGTTWSSTANAAWAKNSWQIGGITAQATNTGANTTTFRIEAAGLQNASAAMFIDNIIISGCPRVYPPKISKLFAQNPILANGISTLTFTITNPNQAIPLSGVAFSDTFPVAPGAMTVASPLTTTNNCGGTVTDSGGAALAVGSLGIKLAGGTVAAGSSCTITVNVTAPTIGAYINTSGAVTATGTVGGLTASDTLTVSPPHPAISILKKVSKTGLAGSWTNYIPVATGATVYYQFTVENVGDVDLTTVSVTDPAFGTVCSPGNLTKYAITTCTAGPVAAVSGFHLNTATAHGFYGATEYTDSSIAAYATTGLTITKSATESYFLAAGNLLHYTYIVKNTGYAPLLGPVTVTDDKATVTCPAVSSSKQQSDGTTAGDGDNYLDGIIDPAKAEQITCTATYTVTAADVTAQLVTNIASAAIDGVTSPTASETVPLAMPSLLVVKSVTAYSDPVNGATGPKAIPGSFMTYTILVTNTGPGQVDNNTTVITDPIPANTELFVGDVGGVGSGPVLFTNGATASGLSYSFTSLASAADNVSFSNDGATSYVYSPTADANLCDTTVTHLKISLGGIFGASDGTNHPSFSVQFRVRVK